jgi:hypothetical protein
MRKSTFLFILLFSAMCLPAQQSSSSDSSPSGGSITVLGCVLQLNGGYSLAVDARKQYYLAGDDAVLHRYLGQKVRVLGNASYRKKAGTNGKAENMVILAGSPQTLTVSRIDKVADTCGEKQ